MELKASGCVLGDEAIQIRIPYTPNCFQLRPEGLAKPTAHRHNSPPFLHSAECCEAWGAVRN
jgi:hypothetical protein